MYLINIIESSPRFVRKRANAFLNSLFEEMKIISLTKSILFDEDEMSVMNKEKTKDA